MEKKKKTLAERMRDDDEPFKFVDEKPIEKSDNFTIYKADEDQRLVFGWASVAITVDGEELEDRQHDVIDPEDLEDAAYEYVLNFRDAGEEHLPGYRKKGKLVESCVFTPDKQKAMGIPEGVLPVAWWIGFKIDDDDTWRRVKDGTYKMFSIEGKANREEIQKAENPTGCGVLVVKDGKILTANRIENGKLGRVGGPGGHIEEGETPEKAARREAYEEFGILCDELVPLGIQDGGEYGKAAVFMCSKFSGNPRTDDEEMTGPKWIEVSKIKEERTYPPFMQSLELLPEEYKTIRTAKSFSEVRKFNPFHDAIGRFSSAQGMRTYSANPKTKAGAMAIGRSAGRHGHVMNIHRESKGENIGQNYQWIISGNKPWQNAAQAAKPATTKPKATAKPNTQTTPKQPAQQAQNASQSTSKGYVQGKDITNTVKIKNEDFPSGSSKQAVTQVAEQQGYLGKPQVVTSKAEFDAAVKASGVLGYRTVKTNTDIVSGKQKTGQEFADTLMKGSAKEQSLNGNGRQAFGGGIYVATTSNPKAGKMPSAKNQNSANQDSKMYGDSWNKGGNSTIAMTLSPKAKVGDYNQLDSQFRNLPRSTRQKFGYDVGAWAASQGYDAIRAKNAGWGCDYTVVYNRTALIMYGATDNW